MSLDNQGYISLHRKVMQNFLFKEKRSFSKFEAWLFLLMNANHSDSKVLLGNQLIDVKRGSFITSEVKLMDEFKWSKSKLRTFLSLLESQSMIEKITDTKKTTLTIVKYSDYQEVKTTKEPRKNREKTAKRPRADTNNNDNNYNNDNNENKSLTTILTDSSIVETFDFKKSLLSLNVPENIVNDWIKVRKNKKATNSETAFKKIVNEIAKTKITPSEAIQLCVERSWSGFQSDWYTNQNKSSNTPKEYEPNAHVLKIVNRLHKDGNLTDKQAEVARITIANSPTTINVQQLMDGVARLKRIGDDFDIVNFRDSLRIE
jgi:DNA replication protein DnaD